VPRRNPILLAMAAVGALALASPVQPPSAGFTRGAHTTRRRTNPLQAYKPTDPEIAAWNAAVTRRNKRAA
jgi:hypothetical protein